MLLKFGVITVDRKTAIIAHLGLQFINAYLLGLLMKANLLTIGLVVCCVLSAVFGYLGAVSLKGEKRG